MTSGALGNRHQRCALKMIPLVMCETNMLQEDLDAVLSTLAPAS